MNYGKGNTRLFRTQGFILDVPSSHIQAGYWRDFGSGCGKNERDLFSTYLFSNIEQRTYFSNQLKRHLHLSDSEYIKLIEKIEDLSIYELEQQHPNVAKAYRKIIHEAEVSKRTYGRNYNEVLVNNPKVQAIFCYDQSPKELPAYMRRFAQKNNIPIIVF